VAIAHADPSKEALLRELQARYPPSIDSPQPAARVLRSGEPELLAQLSDADIAAHARGPAHERLIHEIGLRSHLAVPLRTGGQTVGTLSLGLTAPGRQFDSGDLELASELGRRAAAALENASLYRAG